MAYNNAGNRLGTNYNGTATVYTPNKINQYTGTVGSDSISNLPNHQIQSYQNVTYTYLKDQLLTAAASGTNSYNLSYDALGRCVKRVVNGVTKYYVYDGDLPILEYNVNGTPIGRNLYGKGIDEILMRWDGTVQAPNPQTFYYQQDHEGSVVYLIDGSGNRIEKYLYDVFGNPAILDPVTNQRRTASIVSNRFLFTGREFSSLFGFYEYRARAYHPLLGRFTSEDPKLFDAGDYNLFRYCHNDPLDMTDPMGLGIDNPLPPVPQWTQMMQQLQNRRQDLIERAQSSYEMDHTPNASAKLRQSYAEINQQKLSLLGSVFRPMASRFIGSANEMLNPEGYEVKVADQGGYRSFEEQAKLRAAYEAGGPRANRPGESAHNYGAAIDVDIIKGSRANEDIGRHAYNNLIGRLGTLGESQGLIWGGRFTHPDPPHFQYPGIPLNGLDMLRLHQQLLRTTGRGLDALMGVP